MIVRPAWFSGFVRGVAPPQKQPWPFSILFKTVVLFMTWGIVVSAVSGLIEAVFPKFGSDNFYMILHTALLDALCVFFMVRFLHRQGSGWRELGFQVPDGKVGREIGVGLAAYVGFLPVFFLVLIAVFFFASLMAYEPPPHPLVNVFLEEEKRQPLLVMFSVLLGTVIGPIFEEIFFRGFCYPVLRGRIGKFWAMTASSIFFAATHRSGFAFWPIFVLGMGLAYLYESRKSLISPIVMHITHNTLFILYFFLVKQVIS
jgi:membrane protease YdiL (CAAX protease family)